MDRTPQQSISFVDHPAVDHTGGRPARPPRYSVRPATDLRPGASAPWTEQLLTHFLRVGSGPNGARRLVDSSEAVVRTLCQAMEIGRWQSALALARVAGPAFALSARWGAWASTLEVAERAAQALDDQEALGWALHEKGVRAMALGRLDEARELLSRALEIRQAVDCADGSLGASAAAERTREQLDQLQALTRAPD